MNTTTRPAPVTITVPTVSQSARTLMAAISKAPEAERAAQYAGLADAIAKGIVARLAEGAFVGSGRAPESWELLKALAAIADQMDGTAE